MKYLLTIILSLIISNLKSQIFIIQYDQNIRWKSQSKSHEIFDWNTMVKNENYEILNQDTMPHIAVVQLDIMMLFFIGGEFYITEVIEKDKYLHLKCVSNKIDRENQVVDFRILIHNQKELFGVLSWQSDNTTWGYYLYPLSFIGENFEKLNPK